MIYFIFLTSGAWHAYAVLKKKVKVLSKIAVF